MRSRLSQWVLALCAVVPLGVAVADDTFRCGNRLIEPGMTGPEVLAMCGEPTSKTVEVQDVHSGNQVIGKTEVQRWTYASYSTTRVLVFDQDTLKAI
jgi:hypothetical protein